MTRLIIYRNSISSNELIIYYTLWSFSFSKRCIFQVKWGGKITIKTRHLQLSPPDFRAAPTHLLLVQTPFLLDTPSMQRFVLAFQPRCEAIPTKVNQKISLSPVHQRWRRRRGGRGERALKREAAFLGRFYSLEQSINFLIWSSKNWRVTW